MRAALLTTLIASSVSAEEVFVFDSALFAGADVVIVGELHDQPDHHLTQAQIISMIRPTAVIFEMLTADQASRVTDDNATDPDLGEILGWEASGWPDFAIYAPIFAALDGAAVVGAAPDAAQVDIARADGAAAAITDPAYGLTIPLPTAEQATREAQMQDSHCGQLPPEMLPWFVDQQRFADAAFARATLTALKTYGAPVVVITGNGHARTDWGMPVYLDRAAPEVTVVSVGQVVSRDAPTPFDLWTVSGTPDLSGDPCAAFD